MSPCPLLIPFFSLFPPLLFIIPFYSFLPFDFFHCSDFTCISVPSLRFASSLLLFSLSFSLRIVIPLVSFGVFFFLFLFLLSFASFLSFITPSFPVSFFSFLSA